ncbi:6445_t:CDS:2 [Funneliformis geosporum]|uniref:14289_t:CDS:1 n=1 Tax=Funneliformis geosporum TaxID=1117311 RepID=A0A9W4T034_9GLOM|nr:14289_t:CDS:2 [Funneliformis geosporum]CAI2189259.1 6445_t:CDS:2 [Funneliformis geosporum]
MEKWNPKRIIQKFKKTKMEKLAEKIGVEPLALPTYLQNEDTAALILKATKQMNVDDSAIFIQWSNAGFNDTAVANCRNGVAGQNQTAIINYIVGSGGSNFNDLNTMFLFRNNFAIARCQYSFPLWTYHQEGVPDVCHSICRINKLSASGRINYEPFDYPFVV